MLKTVSSIVNAIGALNYKGTWDANTNTPTLVSSVGTKGDYYVVSVAGSTNLNGETNWGVGDWAVFNGSVWQKVDGGSTGNFTDITVSNSATLSYGTANGVAYLNGSKVLTTGSALTFDGTNTVSMGSGGSSNTATSLTLNATDNGANGSYILGKRNGSNAWLIGDTASSLGSGSGFTSYNYGTAPWIWYLQTGGEQMRLTSTGLGIGTSSPGYKLSVNGASSGSVANIGYNGDTGTGLYVGVNHASNLVQLYASGSANKSMAFYTGATEVMRYDTSGNLGIGTSSPNYIATLYKASLPVLQLANSTSGSTASDGLLIYLNGANATLSNEESGYLRFQTAGTERAVIDSSGNLGIGTSSPSSTLDVRTSTGATIIAGRTSNVGATSQPGAFNITAPNASGSARTWAGIRAVVGTATTGSESSSIIFSNQVAGAYTDTLTINSSGNLGLGAAPGAWFANSRAFQFGLAGAQYLSVFQQTTTTCDGYIAWGARLTGDRSFVYQTTGDSVSAYRQNSGVHAWFNAPSGTAGNAISFTQAMTLDASGNLLAGLTSPLYGTTNRVQISANGSATAIISVSHGGLASQSGYMFWDGTNLQVANNSTSGALIFGTNAGTERARIPSTGGFVVGTAALATNATTGFLYVPTCAGTPTGTPATQTGTAPIVVDTTNNKLYFYSGGQWRDAGP